MLTLKISKMLFMPWKLNKSYCLIATVWYFRRSVRRSVSDGADERVCVSSLVPQIQKQVHLDVPSANSSSWVNITHLNRTNPFRLFIQTLARHPSAQTSTHSISIYIYQPQWGRAGWLYKYWEYVLKRIRAHMDLITISRV